MGLTLGRRLAAFALVSGLQFFSPLRLQASSTSLPIQVALHWEGREILEPNVEALERLRRAYPEIPFLHLINPSYFLDQQGTDAMSRLLRVLQSDDEVGLYLSSARSLLVEAQIPIRMQPTFWGYVDEQEFCKQDCGLDVPLSTLSREETMRLFIRADQSLKNAGFENLRSFVVRGWLDVPFARSIAELFGYRFDLSMIDPILLSGKLREFPIASWASDRWKNREFPSSPVTGPAKALTFYPQNGGVIELNEQNEILSRFDRVLDGAQPNTPSFAFTLSLSQETAYEAWPRMNAILRELDEKARKKGVNLVYETPTGAKNGRPQAENVRISGRF